MTERDRRFADEYVIDLNAKAAAMRAGYSPATAKNASAWIHPEHPTKPKLRELIERKQAQLSRRTGVTAERLIREAMRIATADLTDIVNPETGAVRPDAARADTAALIGIRVRSGMNGTEYEARMADKIQAIKLVAQLTGCLTEQVNLSGAAPTVIDDVGGMEDGGSTNQ